MVMTVSAGSGLLERRKREVSTYLRVSLDRDEAEAMASAGYKPTPPCGGCARPRCRWCDVDFTEQVQAGGHRPSADPRYVTATINRLSMFDPIIYQAVPRALAALDPEERVILILELGAGLSVAAIADRLKVDRSTVARRRERGLETIVRDVWR